MNKLLKKYKHFFSDIPSLYDYQEEVISRLQQQANTLAIIPTGGGKSLIYQLMALELKGATLVISPLLALMNEQVKELNSRGIRAITIDANVPFNEQRTALRTLDNSYKLIYVSAERLQNPFFKASLIASGIEISMIVVDEAHCISQWGSSFRPDYGQINDFFIFLKQHKHPTFLLCLTATLLQSAREDIVAEFNIHQANIIIKDTIRSNLKLHFKMVEHEDEKAGHLREFIKAHQSKKTIVYLYSRLKCKQYAQEFDDEYRTDYYHSGIEAKEKTKAYEKFVRGKLDILFATTAFGMGINIPDIECVAHLQIPNSVEEYYQQVGRGWRKKSILRDCYCLAVWSNVNFERRYEDTEKQKYTIELLKEAFMDLIGNAAINTVGQVVNKDLESLMSSEHNLRLIKFKLEKRKVITTIGEVNGTPLSIELYRNTPLWSDIMEAAHNGMNSFGYVSKTLNVPMEKIIQHLFEQDLAGNIKKLPALKKDIYFKVWTPEIEADVAKEIVEEINREVNFRLNCLDELKSLFTGKNTVEHLTRLLS